MQTKSSTSPITILRSAQHCLRAGQVARARMLLEAGLAEHPDDPMLNNALGTAIVALDGDAAAEACFARAHAADPTFFDAAFNLGRARLGTGQPAAAAEAFAVATQIRPDAFDAWEVLAVARNRMGDHSGAIEALARSAKISPGRARPHHLKGRVFMALGQRETALECFEAGLAIESTADLHNDMGQLLVTMADREAAVRHLDRATQLDPRMADAWANLGGCWAYMGIIQGPMQCFQTALDLAPNDPTILVKVGRGCLMLSHYPLAEKILRRALTLDPAHLEARSCLAGALERQGEHKQALALTEPIISGPQTATNLALAHGQACLRTGQPERGAAHLREVLTVSRTNSEESLLNHRLGDCLDKMGEHEAAMAAYTRANDLTGLAFDPEAWSDTIDQIIAAFPAEAFDQRPVAREPGRLAALIVGMPRSGTSLVEQIIASHPKAWGAGELEELRVMTHGLAQKANLDQDWIAAAPQMTAENATTLSTWYRDRLLAHASNAGEDTEGLQIITDKMPTNFQYLGLIAQILPGVPVIHCVRNPLDTCLSCYIQAFGDGLPYATRLDWLGHFYRGYRRLMDHWTQVLPLPVLELPYEELVAHPEEMSQAMVAHCGLEWDPDCLRFHEIQRSVRTASYDQVRRPIYRTSIRRSDTYRPWLDPLVEVLGGLVDPG